MINSKLRHVLLKLLIIQFNWGQMMNAIDLLIGKWCSRNKRKSALYDLNINPV